MAKSLKTRILVALADRLLKKLKDQIRSTLEALSVPNSGGIVFLGDSITAGCRWELMFPHLPTRNYGIGGDTTIDILERLEPVVSVQPYKLFLLIGTNDLGREETIESIEANVGKIIDQLKARIPGCVIYLQTVMPRQVKFSKDIQELNRRYAKLAKDRGVELIDLYPLFDDGQGAMNKALSNDDLHLMGDGYKVWQSVLVNHVA